MAPSRDASSLPSSGPPPSSIQTAPNLVAFDPKLAVPSQPLYVQRNDLIGYQLFSNVGTATVVIAYRWLTPDGEIKEGTAIVNIVGNVGFVLTPLYEGWLLSFAAHVSSATNSSQWYFMQSLVFRGQIPGQPTNPGSLIWQGFLVGFASNGWPGTPAKEITDGPGIIRSITGTLPAAGAEISEVVPNKRRWTLLSLRAQLATSAAVANRFPSYIIDDGVNQFMSIHTNVAEVASTTNAFLLTPGNQFFNDGQGQFLLPFPALIALKSGFRINTSTVGIQAGDQWSAPQYEVIEWGLWDV